MGRRIVLGERRQDLINRSLADVYQNPCTRGPLRCLDLILLCLTHGSIQRLPAIVLFQNLPVRRRRHSLVVEFEPPGISVWFDEGKISSIVSTAGVYNYAMELVLPGVGLVSRLIEEFVKIDFEGEFEAIIALRGRVEVILIT